MKQKSGLMLILLVVISLLANMVFAQQITGQAVVANLLNQDPDPAIAGSTVEVRIAVQNFGNYQSSEEYVAEVLPQYPFESVAGEETVKEVGIISATQAGDNAKIVKFKFKVSEEANAGSYNIPVLVYQKGKRDPDAKWLFSVVVKSKESAEIIYIDQVELLPGQITPMKFTITNVGSSPLRDLTFNWQNEDDIILPVGSDNTRYIKSIDIGDSVELTYNVLASANADPDLYKLDLMLTYEDPIEGGEKSIETKAGVYVGGKTDFDVTFSGSSSGETSFSISNIGSVQAGSVTVKIPNQPGWTITGSNSVIIGNLNKGDYTIASFSLQMAGSISNQTGSPGQQRQNWQNMRNISATGLSNSGSSTVALEILYTDTRGNRNTITKEVPITTSTTQAGAVSATNVRFQRQSPLQPLLSSAKWIVLGVVVLALFMVVRKNYKKGRMKHPEYTYGQALRDILPGSKKK